MLTLLFFYSPPLSWWWMFVLWLVTGLLSHDPVSGRRCERLSSWHPGLIPLTITTGHRVSKHSDSGNQWKQSLPSTGCTAVYAWDLCYLCTIVLLTASMDVKVNNTDSTWLQPPACQGQWPTPVYYPILFWSWNGKNYQIKCKSVWK